MTSYLVERARDEVGDGLDGTGRAENAQAASWRLASLPPLEALRRWTVDLVRAMRAKHGLGDALSPAAHRSITERTYDPVIGAITLLLEAGQRDGTIRADADPRDFLQLTGALWRAASGPEDRSQAMLGLVLDGLSAGRPR